MLIEQAAGTEVAQEPKRTHKIQEPTENKTKGGSCRERSTDPHGEPLVTFLFSGADCSAAAVRGKLDLVYTVL